VSVEEFMGDRFMCLVTAV